MVSKSVHDSLNHLFIMSLYRTTQVMLQMSSRRCEGVHVKSPILDEIGYKYGFICRDNFVFFFFETTKYYI
jgi:hypothetical protein